MYVYCSVCNISSSPTVPDSSIDFYSSNNFYFRKLCMPMLLFYSFFHRMPYPIMFINVARLTVGVNHNSRFKIIFTLFLVASEIDRVCPNISIDDIFAFDKLSDFSLHSLQCIVDRLFLTVKTLSYLLVRTALQIKAEHVPFQSG